MAAMADGLLHRQSDGYPIVDDEFIAEQFGAAGLDLPTDPMAMRLAGNVLTAGLVAHYLETAAVLARGEGSTMGCSSYRPLSGKSAHRVCLHPMLTRAHLVLRLQIQS